MQNRTCPATGAAQLFLPSAKTIVFNVWILAETQMCSCSCSLSQLISLFEGATGQILDNLFPGQKPLPAFLVVPCDWEPL